MASLKPMSAPSHSLVQKLIHMRPAFFLMLIVFLCACDKNKQGFNTFWRCGQTQFPDSTFISANLIGSWVWNQQYCFWTNDVKQANKYVKVTFNQDQTFSLKEGPNTVSQGTWKLILVDVNAWGLDLSSPVEYLDGRILFCKDQVLFNDSYIDGCDNKFNKSN